MGFFSPYMKINEIFWGAENVPFSFSECWLNADVERADSDSK